MAREEFIKTIGKIPKENLVYVDESGVDNNITVDYGFNEAFSFRVSVRLRAFFVGDFVTFFKRNQNSCPL